MKNLKASIHTLHQPYHLHILSEKALDKIAEDEGFVRERFYLRHSCDTPTPFVNWKFLRSYMNAVDGTLDAGFDPPHMDVVVKSPHLWFWGLFGYYFSSKSEMIALFRKPAL